MRVPSAGDSPAIARVMMVSSLWPPAVIGGAETYAAQLADRLRSRGVEVAVVTLDVPGDDVVARVPAVGYRLDEHSGQPAHRRTRFHLADLYRRATISTLSAAIAEFRPDVVHTHSVQGMSSTALATPARRHAAHVHTAHDYWLLCQRTSMVARDGVACETRCASCRAVSWTRNALISRHPPQVALAVSRALAREHEGIEWLRDRMRVLYNPIDDVAVAKRPYRSGDERVFGYLGQLTPVKGVATLLSAFERANLGSARLVVAGAGPLAARVGAAGPRVEFRGWIAGDAKDAFFDQLDVLVVPSEWKDPAPLVVNEAVARGIPVVGANAGGIPELVPPSCAPLLFEPGDVEGLTLRLERVAADPEGYPVTRPLGALDWSAHADAVLGAYDDAIDLEHESSSERHGT